MGVTEKAAFFDGIADKWDGWDDLDALAKKLAAGLAELGVGPDERVLDVGCGTGNLTMALLKFMPPPGRVSAVDISTVMISKAGEKIRDHRAEFFVSDAVRLPFDNATFDRAFCFSVWPHFNDGASVAQEIKRVLKPGGRLHIWHLISRSKVNEIHASAGEAIHNDILPPASEVAAVLESAGFQIATAEDGETRYLISGMKKLG